MLRAQANHSIQLKAQGSAIDYIRLTNLYSYNYKIDTGTKTECGAINRDRGIQRLEAMLYALDRIEKDPELNGLKLGVILLDSCSSSTYALNQSLEFIRASMNTVESTAFECRDRSTPRPKYNRTMIAGVVGGSYSEVSLQVANLLRLFRIPQVSYLTFHYPFFDRTRVYLLCCCLCLARLLIYIRIGNELLTGQESTLLLAIVSSSQSLGDCT